MESNQGELLRLLVARKLPEAEGICGFELINPEGGHGHPLPQVLN